MLHLLGFPKAKPETGPGCLYCLASRLSVQSAGGGGPGRRARRAPGGLAAEGLDESQPVFVRLLPPGIERGDRSRDVTVFMRNIMKGLGEEMTRKREFDTKMQCSRRIKTAMSVEDDG